MRLLALQEKGTPKIRQKLSCAIQVSSMCLLGFERMSFLGQDFNLRKVEDEDDEEEEEEDNKLILSVYKRMKNMKPQRTRMMMERGILVPPPAPLFGIKKLIVANPVILGGKRVEFGI